MAAVVDNLVRQTTSGTGTGNLTLAAVTGGYQTFDGAFGHAATTNFFFYSIFHTTASEWEVGTGHMSDATTLVRDTVLKSSNANAAVSFSAGTKNVICDVPAASQVTFPSRVLSAGTAGGTANAQTLTPAPAIPAYVAGDAFEFLPVATNTSGTVTMNVSGLGTKNVLKSIGGGLVALSIGDLIINIPTIIAYDGTQFVILTNSPYGQGADVASAGTINLDTATGDYVHITGTTGITAVTLSQGRQCMTVFDGAVAITVGASLILNTPSNYTTLAGDIIIWRGEASSVVRGFIVPKSGLPVTTPKAAQYSYTVASGTGGNAYTGSQWSQIPLNTEDFDSGSIGSLASNKVTLIAGTYVAMAIVPANDSSANVRLRLRNVTDSTTLIQGTNQRFPNATTTPVLNSILVGGFTLSASKDVELDIYNAHGNSAAAIALSTGDSEVYACVTFIKVG